MKWATIIALVILIGAFAILEPITIFIVPPIGAVPDGRTVILFRYGRNEKGEITHLQTRFLDTADAMCERKMGYVNLLCRGIVLGTVVSGSTILLRLPYSSVLNKMAEG